jgi:uncharacterized Fe-S cluster protein YjdI/CDGSH-type Zn-finger protein
MEERSRRLQVYHTDDLVVTFDPGVCIHSATCLRTLPQVFDVREKRWVRLEGAPADAVADAVARCPSGALQAIRAGHPAGRGGGAAPAPGVEVRVTPDGPLTLVGPVRVHTPGGEVAKEKVSLCRCGHTGRAPFCDGSHRRVGFRGPESSPAPERP